MVICWVILDVLKFQMQKLDFELKSDYFQILENSNHFYLLQRPIKFYQFTCFKADSKCLLK